MSATDPKTDIDLILRDQAISLGVPRVASWLIFGLWFFAEPFDVSFDLLRCLVDVLANLGLAETDLSGIYADRDLATLHFM